MPYLHCPTCRLTIFKPRLMMETSLPQDCPSCGSQLAERPRRLFSARATPRKPRAQPEPRRLRRI